MNLKKIITLSFAILAFNGLSQKTKIDSLLALLRVDKLDTNQLIHLYKLSDEFKIIGNYGEGINYGKQAIVFATGLFSKENSSIQRTIKIYTAKTYYNLGNILYYQGNYTEALKNHLSALKINEAIGDKKSVASSYNNIANIYRAQGNYSESIKNHSVSLEIRKGIQDRHGISSSFNNIGIVFEDLGNYSEALKNYFSALKIMNSIADKGGISTALSNIGNIYFSQNNYPEALKNYLASLKIRQEIDDKNGIADSYGNIGNVYYSQTNYADALKNYFAALKIKEAIGDIQGVASAYTNIGAVYFSQGNYPSALKNQFASLEITIGIGDKLGISASYNNIGSIYTQQKQYPEAAEYYNKAKVLAKETGYKEQLKESFKGLMKTDSAKGDFKSAFQNHKMYTVYSDSLNNEESRKKTIQSQMTYDFDIKEAVAEAEHKSELYNQNVISEERSRKQNVIIFAIVTGLFWVIVFSAFVFRSLHVTRKQKYIIEEQKFLVEQNKELIEEKHKEITDSINYAERIQRSFLATKQLLDENLNDYFIFFKPKDIVSGDFYWGDRLKNGEFMLATADSTGHGVPGAIMSLLNITSIEAAIKEGNTKPEIILNETRKAIISRLKKDGSKEGGKDGMDCSLISFDFENNKLQIASANNSVWIIRKVDSGDAENDMKVIEIKPDKMPVGKHDRDNESFTSKTIDVFEGDMVYALTDGFPDQFGGELGKKFMSKRLKELLMANAHMPMHEQKNILETAFKNWVGDLEQVDDVTIIGVRI